MNSVMLKYRYCRSMSVIKNSAYSRCLSGIITNIESNHSLSFF